ncbi:hypothetical protein TAGGR_254 [Thermodesulfovibrio aggregans]|uniref:Uncharacterized protein n=1 Tax=Thermodesulfovibrio aggregans TaxID=86166 RepID=A0A0U9HW66_9BACT|nr:hypothetical protein [Thermodesulfovibrio aggregans]GAQ95169.1 hypothetical protein TAGGR_254 [Thermodesulfovibrio aggregans]
MIKWREIFDKIEPLIFSPEAIVITRMRRTGKTKEYTRLENTVFCFQI